MHGIQLNEVNPAQERGVVRRGVQTEPAELAQHQAVAHPAFRVRIALIVQMLDDEHPGMTSTGGDSRPVTRLWGAPRASCEFHRGGARQELPR
jgi:hypothetical protein